MYSISSYVKRNKVKVFSLSFIIALGVFATLMLSVILGSFEDTKVKSSGLSHDWVEIINRSGPVAEEKVKSLGAEKIINAETISLGYPLLRAATSSFSVYAFNDEDRDYIMDFLDIYLKEGHMPENENEIVLPVSMLKAKDVSMGDIWQEDNRFLSRGQYQVVGTLEGSNWIGFIYPTLEKKNNSWFSTIAFSDDVESLEKQIKEYAQQKGYLNYLVSGPVSKAQRYKENYRSFILRTFLISVGIAVILAFVLIMLFSSEYKKRRSEIVFLSIVGYSPTSLYGKTILEIGIKVMVGWLSGLLFAKVFVYVLDKIFFANLGMVLNLSLDKIFLSLILPFIIIVSHLIFLQKTLGRDPLRYMNDFGAERKEVKPE